MALALGACTGVVNDAREVGSTEGPERPAQGGGPSMIGPEDATTAPIDPGRVDAHRLSSTEYNATVTDVLGTELQPADGNWRGGELGGFDNMAAVLGMDADQYQRYFDAATALSDEAFESDALRRNLVPCDTDDDACVGQILGTTGTRLFRRPLTSEEVLTYRKVYRASRALGDDHQLAARTLVRALLSSAEFLYRVELDERPDDATIKHPLTAFELATRLSYFLWSSAPDDALLASASDGSLLDDDVLSATVDRMLENPKSSRFTRSFAGQWLGARRVLLHPAARDVYPSWSPALADAAAQEMYLYFDEFLRTGRSWLDFMQADVNFVTPLLADAYGMDVPAGATSTQPVRVENVPDGRRGFAGLLGFLAMSSPDRRSAPTLRGRWLLMNLMCTTPPDPPPDIPVLEKKGDTSTLNVREVLAEHRANPACAACHTLFDPFGLALEEYDGIGRFREFYGDGSPIDPTAELPSSKAYPGGLVFAGIEGRDGLPGVADAVTRNPKFATCVSEKLLTYGLGRLLTNNDGPYLDLLAKSWLAEGQTPSLTRLVHTIVSIEPFRFRRGGT